MDNALAIGVITAAVGAIATLTAVIVTHLLGQRHGEKRANHVKEQLVGRIDAVDRRIDALDRHLGIANALVE